MCVSVASTTCLESLEKIKDVWSLDYFEINFVLNL